MSTGLIALPALQPRTACSIATAVRNAPPWPSGTRRRGRPERAVMAAMARMAMDARHTRP
ncbi:hypothetical protein [Streptomyces avermitilis]|uniref:hypothetical protein n=1 Tax=Streptomyces avermitilis TaxID=33903 RepID=UPI0033BC1FB8